MPNKYERIRPVNSNTLVPFFFVGNGGENKASEIYNCELRSGEAFNNCTCRWFFPLMVLLAETQWLSLSVLTLCEHSFNRMKIEFLGCEIL